jgi:hypothetical protein
VRVWPWDVDQRSLGSGVELTARVSTNATHTSPAYVGFGRYELSVLPLAEGPIEIEIRRADDLPIASSTAHAGDPGDVSEPGPEPGPEPSPEPTGAEPETDGGSSTETPDDQDATEFEAEATAPEPSPEAAAEPTADSGSEPTPEPSPESPDRDPEPPPPDSGQAGCGGCSGARDGSGVFYGLLGLALAGLRLCARRVG